MKESSIPLIILTIVCFIPFVWSPSPIAPRAKTWIPTTTVTAYNDQGFEIEERDILGNYSAAKYGYGKTLPILVAANASESEVFYESFDDPYANLGIYQHQSDLYAANVNEETSKAHTGNKSLRIEGHATYNLPIDPEETKEFVLSTWVSRYSEPGIPSQYPDFAMSGLTATVTCLDAALTPLNSAVQGMPTGEVIEGWQKIEFAFPVPAGAAHLQVRIEAGAQAGNSAEEQYVYVDDLRFFPKDGNVQTHVYDPATFRLQATLDQNNFATYYFYDEEGKLYLVKSETVVGIMTIQATQTHSHEAQ